MKKRIVFVFVLVMFFTVNAFALESFKIFRNFKGDQTFAIPQGYVNSYLLTASTAKTISIPSGARYAVFAATSDIWVRIGSGTAVIPTGNTNNGTGSELNPVCRWIEGETQMSIISAYAARVSISYFN